MAGWFVDHPGVPAAEDVVSYLPYFDTLFSIDPAWIPFISFFNKNVFYLPLATSDIYYKPLNQARNLDFVFAANFFVNDPAGYLKAFIISHLPPTYKVEIYGPDINYFKNIYPQLKNFKCYNEILGARINDVWNSAKLTAVIYHPQVIAGTAPRIFDCALSKTPQIIQETSTIYDLFSGVNLPTFKSIPEFLSKTDYYLNHLKEREELAEAMYKITKQKHLFIHRIKTMMELLNLK